jgi:RNA polymerase sigma factor (sigma-70 family)
LAFVYRAALRQLGGASHRAEEVTQSVFIDLARKSASLTRRTHLAGWLYLSTRFASAKLKRSEQRRQNREKEAHAMNEVASNINELNWEQLRPVLDDALHELPERDRAAILMRFFEGRGFAEMSEQLGLSEDAARMRVERALRRLRLQLERRHLTSTSTVLAVLLANQPAVAIPSGLAASIGSAALLVSPAPASLPSLILMSKIAAPLITGVTAAALTFGLWSVVPGSVTASDLQVLREENARLQTTAQLPTGNASPQPEAPTQTEGGEALAVVQRIEQHRTARAATAVDATGTSAQSGEAKRQHRNHGIATPNDALLTFAWASDAADDEALAAILWFDPDVRDKATATMATLPASLIARYPTPERFYGFITAALCLQAPPPGVDVVEQMLAQATAKEIRPGRLVYPNRYELQHTPEGWKWVFPEVGVTRWLHVLGDSVLTSQPQPLNQ